MYNSREPFQFIADAQAAGQRAVLVTIADVEGSSTRNPGAHLAVSEDGRYAGSLSGGCIEAAIVAEALDVLTQGGPRMVRYGKGSKYIDIRLPCGGAVDLLFTVIDAPSFGRDAIRLLDERTPFRLRLPLTRGRWEILPGSDGFSVVRTDEALEVNHVPPLRIVIVGHGAVVRCLFDQARSGNAEAILVTPDKAIIAELGEGRDDVIPLHSLTSLPDLPSDRWTACAIFFHDHDWEPPLLKRALESDYFYIGAMGSRRTHERRCEFLLSLGVAGEQIARITSPIGLIPSMRDPETMALSTLVQIVDLFNRTYLTADNATQRQLVG